MRKQYNKYYSIFFLVAFIIVGISCSKDDSSEFDEKWEGDIELPALHNSTADIFLSPTTIFNGQQVTTYSMEYDKRKKHARWVAFKYYNVTGQTNWNRNDWRQNGVVTLGSLIRIFLSLINEYRVILESRDMTVVIFVLLQTVFIQKMLTNKLSIIVI